MSPGSRTHPIGWHQSCADVSPQAGEHGQRPGQPDPEGEQRMGQVAAGEVHYVADGGHDGAVRQSRRYPNVLS
jgi:hypothetical protein